MNRDVHIGVVLLAVLVLAGTVGYSLLEGWSLLDSLYMTVITLSTVGFGEIRPLSGGGKLFTSLLILFGVGTLAYIGTRTAEALIEKRVLSRRRLRMEIKRTRDHVVVCGHGRMGATVALLLRADGTPAVVVEKDETLCERMEQQHVLHVQGDATEDSCLIEAGISRARALAAVLPNDADNLFVALSARRLNPDLTIIARSSSEKNDAKMIAAGATRVLNPYRHGGRLMAQQLLQPSVTDFMEVVSQWGGTDLTLREVQLQPGCELDGVNVRGSAVVRDPGMLLVGVRREPQGFLFNPPRDARMKAEDILIVLGREDNLTRLAGLAAGASR